MYNGDYFFVDNPLNRYNVSSRSKVKPNGGRLRGCLRSERIAREGQGSELAAAVEGSGGRTVTVNAENARNLDQVKVGDKVNLRFTEELALFVRKSDAQPSATQADMVALAPKGEKPVGLMARTVELTGTVESIDSKKRTVAVKGPAGNVRTFHVDKAVKNFGQIKKGDQIVLRITEAVALSVVKA